MAIFSAAALGGNGIGPAIAGWIEMNPRLEWRWIQWIQVMYVTYSTFPDAIFRVFHSITGLYLCILPFILKETRSTIILTRMAKKLRKDTGDARFRARVEDANISLKKLIWISCTRPMREYPLA